MSGLNTSCDHSHNNSQIINILNFIKMRNLITLFFSLMLAVTAAQAQVTVTSTDNFNTRDQMLLANEINESGEPFAEALGYDLDELDPMVLNMPDSISYTLGIENYEYSRYLLGTVISRSGIGLHMMWAPMTKQMAAMQPDDFDGMYTGGIPNGFKEDDQLMMTMMHFATHSNGMVPMHPWPQFAEFANGDPHLPQPAAPDFRMNFSSLRWDRSLMDKTLNPGAMGQTLMKQYLWAQDMLGTFHDGDEEEVVPDGTNSPDFPDSPHFDPDNNIYYGGDNTDGFIGQVLTGEAINKTLFLINSLAYDGTQLGMVNPATYNPAEGIKYFPHGIAVTESPVGDMLPPEATDLQVTDASSDLFDQLSYLWGTLSFKNMMDPNNSSDAPHLAFKEVFDGDPFPAPMSQTGMPGPFDLMMGTSKVIFMNLMAMHYDMVNGSFVNTSGLMGGMPEPGNEISTLNAGYITMVLALMKEEFAGTPLEQMALDALNAQSSFIVNSLKDPTGGFYNGYTLNVGADNSAKTAVSQAAAARGLYAAYSLTGNTDYLDAANEAYAFLIENYYVPGQMAFKTEQDNDQPIYTPFNFAVIAGGLREAVLVGGHTEAASIYTRFFKKVANTMQLAEFGPSGETGDDSDGDGIPFLPQQPDQLAPVFAAEATMDITTYEQEVSIDPGWKIISSWVEPYSPALETVFGENSDAVTIMLAKSGIYWPSQNINTIGNWNTYHGYKVKMIEAATVGFTGFKAGNSVSVPAGFSYLPVLSENPVDNSVLADLGDALIYAFSLQDATVFWPEGGIYTLTTLEPGKGYGLFMSSAATVVFPEDPLKSATIQQPALFVNNTTWNDVTRTGDIHIFSIDRNALTGLESGDVIGAFNFEGINVGMAVFTDSPYNLPLIVYGDDLTTQATDGLLEGENIVFKLYRSSDNTTENLEVTFDQNLDNGSFTLNGASRITTLKSETLGIDGIEEFSFNVYPNPSNGIFNVSVSGGKNLKQIIITNPQGQRVFSLPLNGDVTTSIDLSGLSKGVYFIHLDSTEGVKVKKILIN